MTVSHTADCRETSQLERHLAKLQKKKADADARIVELESNPASHITCHDEIRRLKFQKINLTQDIAQTETQIANPEAAAAAKRSKKKRAKAAKPAKTRKNANVENLDARRKARQAPAEPELAAATG